jgi:hypothetical protein
METLEKILSRNLGWIAAADAKVGPALAISTAMPGTLAAFFGTSTNPGLFPLAFLALAVLFLLASIVFLGTAIFPRVKGPINSVIFFGGISVLPRDRYIRKIESLTENELYRDLAEQCHRNAQIASAKYQSVRRAMACLLASIAPWIVALWQLWTIKRP